MSGSLPALFFRLLGLLATVLVLGGPFDDTVVDHGGPDVFSAQWVNDDATADTSPPFTPLAPPAPDELDERAVPSSLAPCATEQDGHDALALLDIAPQRPPPVFAAVPHQTIG